MAKIMNIASYILSMICFSLFFIYMTTQYRLLFLTKITGFHALTVILSLCFIAIIPSLIGLVGASTWRGKIRSIIILTIIVGLSIFLSIVLTLGKLFQFT